MSGTATRIEDNGRRYAWPQASTVVVCIDGSAPAYIEKAVRAGVAPYLARITAQGCDLRADCVEPSFTNPNNLSIVTGRPPSVHGISGNCFLDPDVVHQGAPGSFAAVCLPDRTDAADRLRGLDGVDDVAQESVACAEFGRGAGPAGAR